MSIRCRFCKAILVVIVSFTHFCFVDAAVYVKNQHAMNNVLDKLASVLVHSSELEVNGVKGNVSVYTLHELNSLERLARYLKLDSSILSEDGFRIKLSDEQGGGMIFAIADGGPANNSAPMVIYFSSIEGGSPTWLFPEIKSPEESNIQFSVSDISRNMRMCTYVDVSTPREAIANVSTMLAGNGWKSMTPGASSTSVFFAKGDSVILVAAVPSIDRRAGSTVLIIEKK